MKLNNDTFRHILSFLPVDVYLRFRLICKDAVSREQENKILFFKNELFKVIPKRIFVIGYKRSTKQSLYETLLYKNRLDFFCEENFLTKELKKKIKKITKKRIILRVNKTFISPNPGKIYHCLLY
jgi:hypothetical protein|tara:strand:+ start:347 stop:721 length:375 start_codon:yes stop_codon:yes gene_type:complete